MIGRGGAMISTTEEVGAGEVAEAETMDFLDQVLGVRVGININLEVVDIMTTDGVKMREVLVQDMIPREVLGEVGVVEVDLITTEGMTTEVEETTEMIREEDMVTCLMVMVGHLIMVTMATLLMDIATTLMVMGMLGVVVNPIQVLVVILEGIILIIRVLVWILTGEEAEEVVVEDLVSNKGLDPLLVCQWEEPCLLFSLLVPPCSSRSLEVWEALVGSMQAQVLIDMTPTGIIT